MRVNYDVIIIGSGPSGMAVATELKQQGYNDIVILEREQEAGGVPRHCQHPTFGVLSFHYPMKGNHFAEKILSGLEFIPVLTGMTVVDLLPNGRVRVSCDKGLIEMQAKRVVLATGARETPRHPRLVSGLRPQGVLTTGALQQFIYLNRQKPCVKPVVIGSEIVSFSALWTLRNAGIKPIAMIEAQARITANRPVQLFATLLGVPVYLGAKLLEIGGLNRVEYVVIEREGKQERIECDAVIFTGQFVGEHTLIRKSHLEQVAETGAPRVDVKGRCSDASYYAVGNMMHPADMGDQCYLEGRQLGRNLVADLNRQETLAPNRIAITHDEAVQFTVPNSLDLNDMPATFNVNLRVTKAISGQVVIKAGDKVVYQGKHRCLPGRRILIKGIKTAEVANGATELQVTVIK